MKTKSKWLVSVGAAMSTLVFAACGSSASPSSSPSHPVTLTLWQEFGTGSSETVAMNKVIHAFEKLHPNIKVDQIAQPVNNYFSLLQAASISRTGPDLAVVWTGAFLDRSLPYIANISKPLAHSNLLSLQGVQWVSKNSTISDGVYGVPYNFQYYLGYYNKALFSKAGISTVPRDWTQLYQDCAKLKAHGITPFIYGSTSGSAGAEFYPYWSFAYMMAGAYPLSSWKSLFYGRIPWTSPAIATQVQNWVALYKRGYTNKNVLTMLNAEKAFMDGQGAMFVNGNWFTGSLEKGLGNNLGVFVPPFSTQPMHAVIGMPGDAIAMTKYAKYPTQSVEFLQFLTTPTAQKAIASAGLIPADPKIKVTDPLSRQLVDFAAVDHYQDYPMLDNVTPVPVVNTASTELDAAFAGDISVNRALTAMVHSLQSIPASQKPAY